MNATKIALATVRLTGATQVVLGILFWTGLALSLIPVHMAIGLTFVLSLWVFAGLSIRTGARPKLAAFTILWGGLVLALGIAQTRLLLGPRHWIVQLLHLLVGVAAMALAARLAQGSVRGAASAVTIPSASSHHGRDGAGKKFSAGIGSQ